MLSSSGNERAAYRVIITADALADLEAIAAHICEQSPQNSATVAERILDGVDSLASMPRRYRVVGRSISRGSSVHKMVVDPFVVYYRVDERPPAVFVVRVVHGARRQPHRFN